MTVTRLDHVNVVTSRLDEMIAWYEDRLGLTSGPRPDFPFPGAWLYAGDTAVVHLVGHEGAPKTGSEVDLKLEHFAFAATGRAGFVARLEAGGDAYDVSELASVGLVQFHVRDVDGNHVHVDFAIDE